ncbi:MAG: DUF2254 domain-containing protein [Porphyrobacter sp.]|nr:DUF2254 domain-containing protein [Porphyrobacter sp.]
MQPRLLKLLDNIRSSYWFIPSLMALGALAMGAGVVYIDVRIGSEWLNQFGWYQSNTPDGARAVLSTIAGSAITVAGVVFSITIVSVSFAAGQYGPRVLSNFMRDRGNQVTLGTFIATFLYCIIVLRTIRGGPDEREFVPDLAVVIALVLALASISVLIFFIHHVPRSIHANNIVARIGRQLVDAFGTVYPAFIGKDAAADAHAAPQVPPALRRGGGPDAEAAACAVRSPRTGYIEAIDDGRLMELAREHDLILRLESRPGAFIHEGRVFARVWPKARAEEDVVAAVAAGFAVGVERTPMQDTRFLVDELVEVGARALSPGVNDPFTAIACLDWLGAGLSELAKRQIPSPLRLDKDGALRVMAVPFDFSDYVDLAFGQFRQYLASDRNAARHALATLERVAADCRTPTQVAALQREAEALAELAGAELAAPLAREVRAR